MIDRVSAFLEEAIDRQVFPGCTVGIIAGDRQWYGAFGRCTYETDSMPVSEQTVYDVASITKSIPVASLALRLIEDGRLKLDGRLIDTLPEFVGGYRESIAIRHLLTHTLDFGFQLSSLKDLRGDAILEKILSAPLRGEPGAVFSYANASSILLGLVVERITGLSLDEAADLYFFKPLGMQYTTFHPERLSGTQVAPTEDDPWRGRIIRAEVHDESAWALRPRIVGSAGLFSTAPDLIKFAAMLLNGGMVEGMRFFLPETVAAMHADALAEQGIGRAGLGWELSQPSFMGKQCGNVTFGKTGFTGCSVVIDPPRDAAMVLLSNHTYPQRWKDRLLINEVRGGLADIIFKLIDAVR